MFDGDDLTYSFGGLAGDLAFVGDWTGQGKSSHIPLRWPCLLDLDCNGTFDNTPAEALFPFGGIVADVPVVSAWTGG